MSVTTPVTVVSVDACAPQVCSGIQIVVSEAGGRQWTLAAYFPGMSADIVTVGEALDLWIDYRPFPWPMGTVFYWTIVLSRGGTAVMFDASRASDLVAYGIAISSSASGRCFDGCFTNFGANVTYGTETRDVGPYQTVSRGKLAYSHRYFRAATGGCDPPPHEESMAGVTAR